MNKILDNLATHGFQGKARYTKVEMRYVDAEIGYIDGFKIVDVRMLNDGYNKISDYLLNIARVSAELNQGEKVVVCCEAGQSRSPAIALAVLVRHFKMNYWKAQKLVEEKIPWCMIDPSHIDALKKIFKVTLP